MASTKVWWIVVERSTYEGEELKPYVVGPYTKLQGHRELQSDSGIIFCLLTIDAKAEHYVCDGDVFVTKDPPKGDVILAA